MSVTVGLSGIAKKICLSIVQMQFFTKYFGYVWMDVVVFSISRAPKQYMAIGYWSWGKYTGIKTIFTC